MARTAPTYTGTPTYVVVSYRFIDANGQLGSSSLITTQARATVANIEGMADALADMTNANLYDIVVENHTAAGTADSDDAVEEPRESVKDVVTLTQREATTRQTQGMELPAPIDAIFVEDTNDVDTENALVLAWQTASALILPTTYEAVSIRFTERKGYNKSTKL